MRTASWWVPWLPALLPRWAAAPLPAAIAHPQPAPLRLQGLDTEGNVLAPKVVEALLGTRFCGRLANRSPLVRGPWPVASGCFRLNKRQKG